MGRFADRLKSFKVLYEVILASGIFLALIEFPRLLMWLSFLAVITIPFLFILIIVNQNVRDRLTGSNLFSKLPGISKRHSVTITALVASSYLFLAVIAIDFTTSVLLPTPELEKFIGKTTTTERESASEEGTAATGISTDTAVKQATTTTQGSTTTSEASTTTKSTTTTNRPTQSFKEQPVAKPTTTVSKAKANPTTRKTAKTRSATTTKRTTATPKKTTTTTERPTTTTERAPVVTEPPYTQPPYTEPPYTEPPQTMPPQTMPPSTEPIYEPPYTEPPATDWDDTSDITPNDARSKFKWRKTKSNVKP